MIQKRTGQTQFKAILSTSHSGTHSCTARGHRTVHSKMFCPVTAHSPTAEVCMQQVVPNQLHIRALLSRKTLSHSSTNRHLYLLCTGKQNLCFLFPTRFVDLLFALYPHNTQFVNRLIPFFSILHFVHDERPLRGAVPCAFRSRVLLCLIFRPVRRRTPAQIHALVTKRQNLHLIIRPE